MNKVVKRFKHNMLRGSFGALSTAILLSSTIIPSYAATSNELRESIGLSPNTYEETTIVDTVNNGSSNSGGNNSSDNNGQSHGQNNQTSEDVYAEQVAAEAELNAKISTYENEIAELERSLGSRIANNSTAYLITVTVDDIIGKQNELEELKETGELATDNPFVPNSNSYDDTESTTYTYDGVLAESFTAEEVENITSLDYNIGYIGDEATSVVENYFRLVTPWGFNKHASEEEYGSKFLGMDLYAKPDDTIVSQWNGVVVEIGNDDSNVFQYIKIYHGNRTYTIYSHVYPLSGVYVGTQVRGGQPIAVAADTSSYEPNKENHIMYQVRLDGEYINPLLIYGTRGKTIYETWLTSHAIDNVVEAGEKYYNDIEDETKPSSQNNPPAINAEVG